MFERSARRLPGLLLAAVAAALILPPPAAAQTWRVLEDDPDCDRHSWNADLCEVRETTLTDGRNAIRVDGGQNGGVSVEGWDRDTIVLRAKIHVWDSGRRSAEDIVADIEIETGDVIRADGPSGGKRGQKWSVSFELMVPTSTDLDLTTNNGGIGIESVDGEISFEARNGGVSLSDLSGDVQGFTRNGGLSVNLTGDSWNGDGLDVETTNGGLNMRIPEDYSAELITGTVNGGLDVDFPVSFRSRHDKRIRVTLGDGGPRVRATTRNGGVRIKQR